MAGSGYEVNVIRIEQDRHAPTGESDRYVCEDGTVWMHKGVNGAGRVVSGMHQARIDNKRGIIWKY